MVNPVCVAANRPVFVNQGMTFCIEMYAFGYTDAFECSRAATDLF